MKRKFRWRDLISSFFLLTVGAFISAIAVIVFMAPFEIAPGGISGIAVILNKLIGTPIGLMILVGNIPIQILAFRMLGGWQVIAKTVYVLVIYSVAIDLLTPYLPTSGLSTNVLLNALFGGILGGVSSGLVYRGGATFGGTSTLGRILQLQRGTPLSTTALYTDTLVVVAAGLVFGWEGALYAMVALFIGGVAADYVLEGPSVIRTAFIITDHPQQVADAILGELHRGVTAWPGTGMYTDKSHSVLFVTVARPQVNALLDLVANVDPNAFTVIGQGHVAYGHGFRRVQPVDAGDLPIKPEKTM